MILETADYLIDFHNAWTDSLSFVFRDRVLYRADTDAEANRARAEALSAKQDEMIQAFGHTVIREFPAEKYIEKKLHRSTSGAALLIGGIPGFTVELGTGLVPDPNIVSGAVAGTRNVLRWAGMLPGSPEAIQGVKVVKPGFPVRRCGTPRAKEACVALHMANAGDLLEEGDPVALIRDVWGRPLGEGVLRAERRGFVMGRAHGIYFYPGDPITYMAIQDETPLIVPYPSDFFEVADG